MMMMHNIGERNGNDLGDMGGVLGICTVGSLKGFHWVIGDHVAPDYLGIRGIKRVIEAF